MLHLLLATTFASSLASATGAPLEGPQASAPRESVGAVAQLGPRAPARPWLTDGTPAPSGRDAGLLASPAEWWSVSKGLARGIAAFSLSRAEGAPDHLAPLAWASLTGTLGLGLGWALFAEGDSSFGDPRLIRFEAGALVGLSFAPFDVLRVELASDIGWGGRGPVTLFAGLTFIPGGAAQAHNPGVAQRLKP
jgi:hypothetical protein